MTQAQMQCPPADSERRDDALLSFFLGNPLWRLRADLLVLEEGRTTFTLRRDGSPPPLAGATPARP
jgi:hypothetical protein